MTIVVGQEGIPKGAQSRDSCLTAGGGKNLTSNGSLRPDALRQCQICRVTVALATFNIWYPNSTVTKHRVENWY